MNRRAADMSGAGMGDGRNSMIAEAIDLFIQ